MSQRQADRPVHASRALPIVPFAAWALLVLAYHIHFFAELVTHEGVVITAVAALPSVVAQGLLRIPTLLASAALWAIAVGSGMAILRRAGYKTLTAGERAVFGGALGMGIFALATFVLGAASGEPPWLLRALLTLLVLATACAGARELWRALAVGARRLDEWRQEASLAGALIVILASIIVLIALTRANVPVVADYDSLEYHLAAPAQWWRAGRIYFIRDVVYTNFPQNVEMLYLLAMTCFGGPVVGAAVGLQVGIGFVLLAAAAVAACGRRLESPLAGRAGAALVLTTPMLGELATLNSYVVELPLAAYGFLSLFAFLLLRRAESPRERWRYAILCGAMIGLAIGCKYPAALFVLAPVVAFIVAGGVLRPATLHKAILTGLGVVLVALLAASPWLIRNVVNTGNPTYPLLYSIFGGSNWTPRQEARFAQAHRPDSTRFVELGRRFWKFAVWRDRGQGVWGTPASPLLVIFALVPVALADRRSARPILYFAIVFLAVGALLRFAPDRLPRAREPIDVLMAAFVLALVTSPAFLLRRGDSIFLALYCVLWLIAWYTLTHRLDRFLDPMTPALAALGGIGFASLSGRTGRRMGQGLLVGGLAYAAATTFLIYAAILQVGLALPVETFVRGVSEPTTYSHAAIEKINKELAPDATVLFVGEARTFYCRRRALAATVFDRHPIDRILDSGPLGDAARRVRDGLRELGVTHLYVNWPEIARLAGSYTYRYGGRVHRGLRDEVYARLFARMTERGYLRPIAAFGKDPQGRPVPRFILYALAGARDTRLGHTLLDRAALPSTRQSRYGDGRRSIQ